MELEERIDLLEQDLTELKLDIKGLLIDLKDLVLKNQNPLSGQAAEASLSRPGDVVVIGVPESR